MDFTLYISYKTPYFIHVNEHFSVLHYSSTQQAAIHVLHNDSAVSRRYTESNEKTMLTWIRCSAHPKLSS